MDVLVPPWAVQAWELANKVLSYPVIALLASIVFGSSFLFRRVRNAARRYLMTMSKWIRERLRAWPGNMSHVLGIATKEDLDELREEFAKQLSQAIRQPIVPVVRAETPGSKMIERFGTKIGLDGEIWRHLGKDDPRQIASTKLDRLLKGPFCLKCSYLLSEWNGTLGAHWIDDRCTQCSHRLDKASRMKLADFKNLVYRTLDAEMLQTGTLKDTA